MQKGGSVKMGGKNEKKKRPAGEKGPQTVKRNSKKPGKFARGLAKRVKKRRSAIRAARGQPQKLSLRRSQAESKKGLGASQKNRS